MDFATDQIVPQRAPIFERCREPLDPDTMTGAGSRLVILVTGGLGFIGKHFVQRCLELRHWVTNIDSVNYAADRAIKDEFDRWPNYRFIQQDIAHLDHLPECDVIVNFAAESHVDNSIASNEQFCRSNILGVQHLLELARMKQPGDRPRFIQISTDEVYGDIASGAHTEAGRLCPSNPYAATKAAADMLVMSWARTYRLDTNIIRPTNNYGPHQYPEKLIPKSCARLSRGKPAILHGDGSYQRCWLHVQDAVEAVLTVIAQGQPNTIYNIAGDLHVANIEILRRLARFFSVPEEKAWTFVEDRSGQDRRYSLDDRRIRTLGWAPTRQFDRELEAIARSFDFKRFL
ncbi:dTDP-glucose 4,6-dehydratase [Bradyrhizobium ottawaense]|uniref:dTDP-glucose 4,6-dehydratase n=1 Tax=Bradyrhizobium ottawaense TaxID=931866 RepID=UPI0010407C47|nr:GDP-mannose 4,6-dehydratase [Bradyrhizobium ottawaense]